MSETPRMTRWLAKVCRLHREGFKRFWTRRSRAGRVGRPALDRELVGLIRKMSRSNVTWGAPRIRNELAKRGIEVAVSTVARYMVRERKPTSPSWRAFLDNHAGSRRARSCRAAQILPQRRKGHIQPHVVPKTEA